jgi:hypothetical protein
MLIQSVHPHTVRTAGENSVKSSDEKSKHDSPLDFTRGNRISIFVCHSSEKGRASVETRKFLYRTSNFRDFEIADLFAPDRPESTPPSFADFISDAQSAAKYDHIFLIRSSFRISMQSIKLLQHSHVTHSAHLSTPRVAGTRALAWPLIDLREWHARLSLPIKDFGSTTLESRPFKYGRCEAVFLVKKDIQYILNNVSFLTRFPQRRYAKQIGICRLQRVVDSVVFN